MPYGFLFSDKEKRTAFFSESSPRTKCTIVNLMGIYLNPGNDNFIDALNTGIYVDKTLLIDETNSRLGNSNFKFLCVARTRRFGKSMAGNMLAIVDRTVGERREQACVMPN